MFEGILVPLDGSTQAERALPMAAKVARASGGSVMLLRVIAPVPIPYNRYMSGVSIGGLYGPALEVPAEMDQDAIDGAREKVKRYLEATAASSELKGITVETTVIFGAVAASILAAAQWLHADLIVLCSRGYTGFKRWASGSVAQQVAREAPVPVLILHEERGMPASLYQKGSPARLLVALDGSPLAEEALVPAAYLSAALSAPLQGALHLTQVIRLPIDYEYGQMDSVAKARQQGTAEASAYLRNVEQRLRHGDLAHLNLRVSSSVAVSMDVARALISIAEHGKERKGAERFGGADIIALATHGRSGIERLLRGSVTERILGATKLPLLIVRPASVREDLSRKTAAPLEKPGQTTGARLGETEETAIQAPSWVGLL
jgi:nucleotide-binding universal stress UspA family protein